MIESDSLNIPSAYVRALARRYGDVLAEDRDCLDPVEAALAAPGAAHGVPLAVLFRLIKGLNDHIGRHWTVDAASAWRTPMHGNLDVAARSAPTVGDAIDIFARYGHVRASFASIRKQAVRGVVTLLFKPSARMPDEVWQPLAESVMMSLMAMLRQVTDDTLDGIAVSFPWPRPPHADLVEDMLGVPTHFDSGELRLSIAQAVCTRPSPFDDAALLRTARAELDHEARRFSGLDLLLEDVGRLLATAKGPRPNEEQVARALGLSRRTLVRRLAANGTSFRVLLDEQLKARATAMRSEGRMTRAAMAEALGYADPTSFSRAWRRWFGPVQ